MPAKPLTPEQKDDAARLKRLFQDWQRSRSARGEMSSQDWCAESLGFGQSAITQYLNGRIPLNPEASSRFAALIGVSVDEFSTTIADEIRGMAASSAQPFKVDGGGQSVQQRVAPYAPSGGGQVTALPVPTLTQALMRLGRAIAGSPNKGSKALTGALASFGEDPDNPVYLQILEALLAAPATHGAKTEAA